MFVISIKIIPLPPYKWCKVCYLSTTTGRPTPGGLTPWDQSAAVTAWLSGGTGGGGASGVPTSSPTYVRGALQCPGLQCLPQSDPLHLQDLQKLLVPATPSHCRGPPG